MRRVVSGLSVVALIAVGCSSDGKAAAVETTTRPPPVTTSTIDLHGLDIKVPDGFQPVPAATLGFGLAVPSAWQGAILTDEAMKILQKTFAVSKAFLDSANQAKDAGALFYAAGIDEQNRVSDLKVQRLAPAPIDQVARASMRSAPPGAVLTMEGDRGKLRFKTSGMGVTAEGTQWLIPRPDAVWSLVITSEDPATHDALAKAIAESVVFLR